jgi:hypothetical protein
MAKTHEGVHNQFNRLARGDSRFDLELRRYFVPDIRPEGDCGLTGRAGFDRTSEARRNSARNCDTALRMHRGCAAVARVNLFPKDFAARWHR